MSQRESEGKKIAINIDAAAVEARYGQKTGQAAVPVPMQDLWAPGSGAPPPKNPPGSIPAGQPVPPGVVISQVVGRGQPAPGVPAPGMAVVPPQQQQSGQPAMAVVPPQATNRTGIGTFVEISPSVSNPMTATPPPINTGLAEAPVVQEAPKPAKRKKVDLPQEILTHIWELGGEKSEEAQKFYERSMDALKMWQKNPGKIPLEAVVKFLNKRPGVMEMIAEDLEPHFAMDGNSIQSLPNRGKRSVMVCSPVLERPTLPWAMLMVYLAKKYELGFQWQADTMITRSRNMLAHKFLQTGALWSLWVDGDIAAPIANADWYRGVARSEVIPDEACRYDSLNRLESGGKAIIGGVYASRIWHGRLVIQPEIHPRHHEDKLLCNDIRKGTARGLAAVDWIGFGLALVHREVFLEVQRRFPDLAPKTELSTWGFFDTQGDMGEDEAFCQRVRACSIPIWLDTQLICGHIGNMCYMPEHSAAVAAL